MARVILCSLLATAVASPTEIHRDAKLSQKFDFGTFNEITSQLDPEKFEEQMTKAMLPGNSASKTAFNNMMGKLQNFAKDESKWEQEAIDAFHGKLSASCDKLVESAGKATVSLQKKMQEQKVLPYEEDEGCIGQLSEMIKSELTEKLGNEQGFRGLGSAVAYVAMQGANLGCESEANMAGLNLEDEAATLCGKAVFEREQKAAAEAAQAAAEAAAKSAKQAAEKAGDKTLEEAATEDAAEAYALGGIRETQLGISSPALLAAALVVAAMSTAVVVVSTRRRSEVRLLRSADEEECPLSLSD